MNIYLVDNINDGHHVLYEKELSKIQNTLIVNKKARFKNFKEAPLKAIDNRRKYLKEIGCKNQIIHLLYFDIFYKVPFAIKNLKKQGNIIIGTLHSYPQKNIDKYLLKEAAKYMEVIVVHSEYIKQQLNEMGLENIKVISYPSFLDGGMISRKSTNSRRKIVVSCIGGTRYDKGLDILIEAFKYLYDKTKAKLVFNIAGKEEDIKYNLLKEEGEAYDVNIKTSERILSGDEYFENIIQSDVILLPYRKMFSGNSGPMTDGVFLEKYIVGPNHGNLSYLINKYHLGTCFETEKPESLARVLNNLIITEPDNVYRKYIERIQLKRFLAEYENIYVASTI